MTDTPNNLPDLAVGQGAWTPVPQLEVATPALGGPGGAMNRQALALMRRLRFVLDMANAALPRAGGDVGPISVAASLADLGVAVRNPDPAPWAAAGFAFQIAGFEAGNLFCQRLANGPDTRFIARTRGADGDRRDTLALSHFSLVHLGAAPHGTTEVRAANNTVAAFAGAQLAASTGVLGALAVLRAVNVSATEARAELFTGSATPDLDISSPRRVQIAVAGQPRLRATAAGVESLGPLSLPGFAAAALDAVPRQQAEALAAPRVLRAGDNMAGHLGLPPNPDLGQACRRDFAEAQPAGKSTTLGAAWNGNFDLGVGIGQATAFLALWLPANTAHVMVGGFARGQIGEFGTATALLVARLLDEAGNEVRQDVCGVGMCEGQTSAIFNVGLGAAFTLPAGNSGWRIRFDAWKDQPRLFFLYDYVVRSLVVMR